MLTFKSRTRLTPSFSLTTLRAKRKAASSKSPSAKASNNGVPRSFSEGTVASGNNHVERGFGTDHSRQALRAAGARQKTQLHFRQRDFCPGGATR